MKLSRSLQLLAMSGFAAVASLTAHAGGVAYVTGSGQPWGTNDFVNAFNADFGAGNWSAEHFSDGAALFDPSMSFIMLEGGDGETGAFDSFFNTPGVIAAAQNWVSAGGSLFINGGTWPGAVDQNVGFGLDLHNGFYDHASGSGYAVTGAPGAGSIFTGATGLSWNGDYFSHDVVLGGGTALITTGPGGSGFNSLVEENVGSGFLMVGGLTAPTFWTPEPQGTVLLDNLIDYGASQGHAGNAPDGASTAALFGAGVLALAALSRRRLATLS